MILIANNNMSSSDNKENLSGIDFDIDTPIDIEWSQIPQSKDSYEARR